jgi:hypothetical protein
VPGREHSGGRQLNRDKLVNIEDAVPSSIPDGIIVCDQTADPLLAQQVRSPFLSNLSWSRRQRPCRPDSLPAMRSDLC